MDRLDTDARACVCTTPPPRMAWLMGGPLFPAARAWRRGELVCRPTQRCSIPNVVLAGDWVKGVNHGANGLSQERAYVTGLTAANHVIDLLGGDRRHKAVILDVEPDEPHIAAGRALARAGRALGLPLPSPLPAAGPRAL